MLQLHDIEEKKEEEKNKNKKKKKLIMDCGNVDKTL